MPQIEKYEFSRVAKEQLEHLGGFLHSFVKPLFGEEECINLYQVEQRFSMYGGQKPQWTVKNFGACFTVVETYYSQCRQEFEINNVDAVALREKILTAESLGDMPNFQQYKFSVEAIRQLEESKSSGFVYRFEKPLFDEENINLYQVEKRLSMTGGETPQWNMATFRPCFTVVQTSGSQSRLEFELVNVDAGVLREQICKLICCTCPKSSAHGE